MDNMELNQFYEDVCNLGRVLPNLAASVIYKELNNFKDNPDRVQLILKKYFSSYEPEVHNCMSDDIKKIKRVVPSYPFIHINNDLLAVEEKDNRVQLVLKSYFDAQLKLSKRSLDDNDDINEPEASAEKKIKTHDASIDILLEQANLPQNYPTTSETESYTISSNDIIDINQLEKSENNDQNSIIVTEKEQNIEEIPTLSTINIQYFDISEKPNDQIVETNKDSNNQNLCNTPENPSILSLLSSLFPQHSSEVLKTICEDFAVVPEEPPDEPTMNMMVQIMLNYNINEEEFQQDKTESCDNEIPVSACSSAETNEKIVTQEDEVKENEDINLPISSECDKQLLEGFEENQECSTESYKLDEIDNYFFQDVVNGFVLDLSRSAENNTAPNNSIIKPATFHPKQNTMSTDTGNRMKPTKPILKPSIMQRNCNTLLPTNFNTGSKPKSNSSPASAVHDYHNHRPSSKSKPILRPSILQRNCSTAPPSRLNKGSNDILQNKIGTPTVHEHQNHNPNYNKNTTKFHVVAKKEPVKTATVTGILPIKRSDLNIPGTSTSNPLLKGKDVNKTPIVKRNNVFVLSPTININNILDYNFDSKKDQNKIVPQNTLQLNTKTKNYSGSSVNPNVTIVKQTITRQPKSNITKTNYPKFNSLNNNFDSKKDQNILVPQNILQLNPKTEKGSGSSVNTKGTILKQPINIITQPKLNIIQTNDPKFNNSNNNFDSKKDQNMLVRQNILQLNTETKNDSESSNPKVTILNQPIIITTQPKLNTIKINDPKSNHFVQGLADCGPSTSGLRNGNTIDTSSKSSIRVRTDLYDMYFNGPFYDSSSDSSSERDNDDVILVSVDRVSDDTSRNIIQNDAFIKPVKVEETSTNSEEPSTSKIQQASDVQATHPFYFKLLEIFPDICPDYLKKYCSECTGQQTMDDMVSVLLNGDYKRRDRPASPENVLDFEEQHKILQDLFPDADPSYLQHHCERLIDQPENFKQFVSSLIEHKSYPTKADYLKKMKLSAQEKQYTTEFNVEKFLEVIPNPEEHFNDPERCVVSQDNFDDINYAITFLKNRFCTTIVKDIINVFKNNDYSVIKSATVLEKLKNMKTKRRPYPVTSCKNIPLLQEIAYVKHKHEILFYIRKKELEKQVAREQAKSSGLMKTCQCCYDDEIMPEDIETCESGKHIFCKDCIRRGCEVIIGDGKLEFPCLETCDSFFTLQVLQTVLTPKVFSKMAQRKQMEEVKSAGIEDLESCPFCDFATIPAPGDKIFRCLNDDCMKESCRLCKEPSHIPLRCDEVEKDKDVKMRTYIENKMTEALLRKCYKCGLKFIKESGCNKMTCSCGAMMCYVCNKPVTDYRHFNGQGGDQFHLCPLYSDTHKLHMDAIKQSAESAMKELGVNSTNELKIDPTIDLEQHYRRLAEQNPAIPNVPMVFPNINNVIPR